MHHEGVVGVHGVLQHQHPVAVEHGEGGPEDVVPLEHLRRDVLLGSDRLAVSHPDEHHSLDVDGGVFAGLHAWGVGHLGVGAFGEESDAIAVAVEGCAVVGAGQKTLEIAAAHGQVDRAVRTPVEQGLHLTILVAEEDHVGAQHSQHLGPVLPDVFGRQGRIPVFPVASGRNAAAAVAGVSRQLKGGRAVNGLSSPPRVPVAAGVAGQEFVSSAFRDPSDDSLVRECGTIALCGQGANRKRHPSFLRE